MSQVGVGDLGARPTDSAPAEQTIGMPEAAPASRGWETELSAWRIALGQAERANRNLIQYAGAFAALLGIGAGSSGMFAMVKAINKTEDGQLVPGWALLSVFAVGAVTAIVLVCLLSSAYRSRRRAERRADAHFGRLIEKRPDLFLPGPGR